MGASSQMRRFACQINIALAELGCIVQVDVLVSVIGIFNVEWAVDLTSNDKEAIPDDATTMTFLPSFFIDLLMVFRRNVLPVPPGPSRKLYTSCSRGILKLTEIVFEFYLEDLVVGF